MVARFATCLSALELPLYDGCRCLNVALTNKFFNLGGKICYNGRIAHNSSESLGDVENGRMSRENAV